MPYTFKPVHKEGPRKDVNLRPIYTNKIGNSINLCGEKKKCTVFTKWSNKLWLKGKEVDLSIQSMWSDAQKTCFTVNS